MRSLLVAASLLAACAGGSARPDAPAGPPSGAGSARPDARAGRASGALAELEASRVEVEAIAAAARDANAALHRDAARWAAARLDVSTPFDRAQVERNLAAHAQRHQLQLSQFILGPPAAGPLDLPEAVHPAAPYPVRARDTLIEVPLRFTLAPLRPERIEAFIRTLPEVRPLVIVESIERGRDFVEVSGAGATFRAIEPAPRFKLEMPPREELLVGGLAAGDERAFDARYDELAQAVEATNEALAALSAARLRHERLKAWEAAREKSARQAAEIELPRPAARDAVP